MAVEEKQKVLSYFDNTVSELELRTASHQNTIVTLKSDLSKLLGASAAKVSFSNLDTNKLSEVSDLLWLILRMFTLMVLDW